MISEDLFQRRPQDLNRNIELDAVGNENSRREHHLDRSIQTASTHSLLSQQSTLMI